MSFPIIFGGRSGRGGRGEKWLHTAFVRDWFPGVIAAGSVHNTPTADGRGLRLLTDTTGAASVNDGLVMGAGPAAWDPGCVIANPAGAVWALGAGALLVCEATLPTDTNRAVFGVRSNTVVGNPTYMVDYSSLQLRWIGAARVASVIGQVSSAGSPYRHGILHLQNRHQILAHVGNQTLLRFPGTDAPLANGTPMVSADTRPLTTHRVTGYRLSDNGIAVDDTFGRSFYDATPALGLERNSESEHWFEFHQSTDMTGGVSDIRFWIHDANNYWRFYNATTSMAILEVVGGTVHTRIVTSSNTGLAAVFKIKCVPGDVRLYRNDVLVASAYTTAPNNPPTTLVCNVAAGAGVGGGELGYWLSYRHDYTPLIPVTYMEGK